MRGGAIALALILSAPAWAGDPGTVGADFLRIPVAPIPSSLGGAFTSGDGPDSLFFNPAGLALVESPTLSAAHNEYLEGLRQEYLALAYPIKGWGTLAAGGSYIYSGSIQAYDANDNPIGDFNASGGVGVVSYAQRFPQMEKPRPRKPWEKKRPPPRPVPWRIAFGASLKNISERLDDKSGSTTAADVGVLVRLPRDVRLGASIMNLGPAHKVDQEAFPLPRQLRVGASKLFQFEGDGGPSVRVMADTMKETNADLAFMTGVEVSPLPWLTARAGYRTGIDAGSGLTLGVGLGGNMPSETVFKGLRLDYAFADGGPFRSTHRVGVTLRW